MCSAFKLPRQVPQDRLSLTFRQWLTGSLFSQGFWTGLCSSYFSLWYRSKSQGIAKALIPVTPTQAQVSHSLSKHSLSRWFCWSRPSYPFEFAQGGGRAHGKNCRSLHLSLFSLRMTECLGHPNFGSCKFCFSLEFLWSGSLCQSRNLLIVHPRSFLWMLSLIASGTEL